jgi:hypothetical protein
MKTLIVTLLVSSHVLADTSIKTIDSSKYSFNVTQETVKILSPIETKTLASCIREHEMRGFKSDQAFKKCKDEVRL